MWPDSSFATPVSSFQRPVPLVSINPDASPLVCVKFNAYWLPYIIGSLKQLLLQTTWATSDPDTLNLEQGRAFNLIEIFASAQRCVTELVQHGTEIEDIVGIRVDCDCNVWITCCDGTEVQLATVGMLQQPSQPGGGSPQPPSGGGQVCYEGQLDASGLWLAPVAVSTGDVIELSSASGAGNDGVTGLWRCPDGSQFFAGACVGYPVLDGGDPLPGTARMRLIWNIDGTFYDAMAGPITVPSGVSNAQAVLQVNDDVLAGNSGTYAIKVCVTNNATETWDHTWNLLFEPGPFHIESGFGSWSPGIGWRGTDGGSSDSLLLLRQNDDAAITLFETVVQVTALGGTSTTNAIKHDDPAVTLVTASLAAGYNSLSTGPILITDGMFIDVYNNPGVPSSFALVQIHAHGPGAFPY
jgi:hypothetical protein